MRKKDCKRKWSIRWWTYAPFSAVYALFFAPHRNTIDTYTDNWVKSAPSCCCCCISSFSFSSTPSIIVYWVWEQSEREREKDHPSICYCSNDCKFIYTDIRDNCSFLQFICSKEATQKGNRRRWKSLVFTFCTASTEIIADNFMIQLIPL